MGGALALDDLAPRLAAALVLALLAVLALAVLPVVLLGGVDSAPALGTRAGLPAGARPFLAVYADAGRVFRVSPFVLMAIHGHETDFSRSPLIGVHSGVNFAGCCAGPMQFSITGGATPAQGGSGGTWAAYRNAIRRGRIARPADYPGRFAPHPNVYDSVDAIYAAAAYLHALGAGPELDERTFRALTSYGGRPPASIPYAREILARAREYEQTSSTTASGSPAAGLGSQIVRLGPTRPWLVPVPGVPGETCDARIIPDVVWLIRTFDLRVTACFSLGHTYYGEHPLGLAVDLVPAHGTPQICDATWRRVSLLAHLAEPTQNQARAPFRWVGYNGDANHGCGNHLHLSWLHAPAAHGTQAAWVEVFR